MRVQRDGRASRRRSDSPGGDPHRAPRADGQIGTSSNDPIRGPVGSGPVTSLDRVGVRRDGRARRLRSGRPGGGLYRALRVDWQIRTSSNDPIRGSVGSGPATGFDRLGARRDGRAGSRRRGDREGDANPVSLVGGQIEAARNDPIRGSAGSGPATGFDQLGFGGMAVPVGCGAATRAAIRTGRRGSMGKSRRCATTLYAARPVVGLPPLRTCLGVRRDGRVGRLRSGNRGAATRPASARALRPPAWTTRQRPPTAPAPSPCGR